MDVDETDGWSRELDRRKFLGLGAAGAALLLGPAAKAATGIRVGADAVTLHSLYMKQAAYSDTDVRGMAAGFESRNPGIKAKGGLNFVAYESLHDKIVAAAPAGTFDVVLIDVIWPAEFASKNLLVDITDKVPASYLKGILPGALRTAQYKGRLWGLPWIVDTKYLFYNKTMLRKAGFSAPPKTWDQVVTVSQALKKKGIVKYPFIASWAQAEALTADYTQIMGAFGGRFFDAAGKPAFNSGGALHALEWMRMTIKKGLTNPASTESLEDDVRKIVSQGGAAMALNWQFMFALANDPKQSRVAGQIGVAHTPKGPAGLAPGCNGSMALCVVSTSKHKDEALRLIQYMSSEPVEDKFAKLSPPIWKASYSKPQVLGQLPELYPIAKQELGNLINRPVHVRYNEVSQILQVEIQNALLGHKAPKKALDDAAKKVAALT